MIESGHSNAIIGTPTSTALEVPVLNSVTSASSTSLDVTFTGTGADSYEVWKDLTAYEAAASSPKELTGLTTGRSYSITVRAVVSGDYSAHSNARIGTPIVPSSFEPSIASMNFEHLEVGDELIQVAGAEGTMFTGAGTGTAHWPGTDYPKTNTSSTALTGARSGVIYVVRKDEGSSDMGVQYNLNATGNLLHNGDEYWERFDMYFPSDFNPKTGGDDKLKFIMNSKRNGDGTAKGALIISFYAEDYNGKMGFMVISEWQEPGVKHAFLPIGHPYLDKPWFTFIEVMPTGSETVIGQWNSFELYCKVSDVPGESLTRFWCNGVFCFEVNDVVQILQADGEITDLKLLPYWNGAVSDDTIPRFGPSTPDEPAKLLIDNYVVTDQSAPPPNFCPETGYRFIGDWKP